MAKKRITIIKAKNKEKKNPKKAKYTELNSITNIDQLKEWIKKWL